MACKRTAVSGFPEYDRYEFAFGFPPVEILPGRVGTTVLRPTCDNIIFSVVERFFLPDAVARAAHVEYAIVATYDNARELLRDLPGPRFMFSEKPHPLCHVFSPSESIILTLKNKSDEPIKATAAIIGWAFDASREENSDWAAKHERRKALRNHIQTMELRS